MRSTTPFPRRNYKTTELPCVRLDSSPKLAKWILLDRFRVGLFGPSATRRMILIFVIWIAWSRVLDPDWIFEPVESNGGI